MRMCLVLASMVFVLADARDSAAQGCPPGQVWNGYQCQAAGRPGACGCSVTPGGSARCVEGSPGWWYVHVGGQRTDWSQGTDALCCTAQASGGFEVGSATGWGQAPCVSAPTREDCQRVVEALGCSGSPASGGKADREAGPIWSQDDANARCPTVCAGGRWTGQWRTTVPGRMSVCECEGGTGGTSPPITHQPVQPPVTHPPVHADPVMPPPTGAAPRDADVEVNGKRISKRPVPTRERPSGPGTETQEGNQLCSTQVIDAAAALDTNFVVDDTSASVIFPGALAYAEAIYGGEYNLIAARRAPLTLSTNLPIITGSPRTTVHEPSLSGVRAAVNAMIVQQTRGELETRMSFEVSQVYSQQQLDIALRGSYSGFGLSVDGSGAYGNSSSRSTLVARFLQEFYTLDVDQPSSPWALFADPGEASRVFSTPRTPLYVSSVKYGRAAYFMLETSADATTAEAALKVAYESATGHSASVEAETDFRKLMETSTMKVLVVGGSGDVAVKSVTGFDGFREFILQGGRMRADQAQPIAYTLRYVSDNSVANANVTTRYTKRTCRRNSGTFRVTLHGIACKRVSGDEPGSENEVYGRIVVNGRVRDVAPKSSPISVIGDATLSPPNWLRLDQVFDFEIKQADQPGWRFDFEIDMKEQDSTSADDDLYAFWSHAFGELPVGVSPPYASRLFNNGDDEFYLFYSIEPLP